MSNIADAIDLIATARDKLAIEGMDSRSAQLAEIVDELLYESSELESQA